MVKYLNILGLLTGESPMKEDEIIVVDLMKMLTSAAAYLSRNHLIFFDVFWEAKNATSA